MKFTFSFLFIFLGIFSQFWPSISEFTSFQSIFQSGNYYFFLLDIFISARKYRKAPSTVDGGVYFHSRISYVGIRFFFQVNLSILRHFSSLFPFI